MMKCLDVKILIFTAWSCILHGVWSIWPLPRSYSNGSSVLWILDPGQVKLVYSDSEGSYTLAYDEALPDGTSLQSQRSLVQAAARKALVTITTESYTPWRFHARGSTFEPHSGNSSKRLVSTLLLTYSGSEDSEADPLNPSRDKDVDERYDLNVASNGQATINASSFVGLLHGLTTFTQLFFRHSAGGSYTNLAPVTISDGPMFQHRGLNLDVARTYYPVSSILRTIDALAYNKFNRLHIHITDSQSWPLVIPAIPDLSGKGAYRPEQVYEPADVARIQQYGAANGVQVFLEIDMPGHTSSIYYSQPDLIAAFNVQPDWGTYAAEPPSGTLKLNSSRVFGFLDRLWDDLLPRVASRTAYFHTGGDEVNLNAYTLDDTVRPNDTAILKPLLQAFVDFNHARLRKAGLTPVVWEEILLAYNLTVGKDVVIQTWQSDDAVSAVVKAGHKALAGNYNYWYLDCGQGQWISFPPGDRSRSGWPYNDYCYPRHNWRVMYSYDPLQGVPEELQHLVLGGEVHMWSEQTDAINLDRQLWPRACAAAEILWSGAKDAAGQNRSQVTAQPRLADMRERLVARGVASEPVVMPFCSMGDFCVQPS